MNWYFSKEKLMESYTPEEWKSETQARKQTCAFIQDAGKILRLPQLTIATALVFFHRFYAHYKFRDYDRGIIGITCLFLAGKVEETPKKLRDVIETTYSVRHQQPIKPNSPEYDNLRDNILRHELIVLQTIAFDLTVEHPYKFLFGSVKMIQGNRNLAQVAWNFVNDSLRTTLCLQFKPQLIASASIYLASKHLKHQLPEGKNSKPWWETFEVKIEDLNEICNQILDLYESSPNISLQDPSNPLPSSEHSSASAPSSSLPPPSPSSSSSSNQPPPPPPPSSSSSSPSIPLPPPPSSSLPPPPPPSSTSSSSSHSHGHSSHSHSHSNHPNREGDRREGERREYREHREGGSSFREYRGGEDSRERDYRNRPRHEEPRDSRESHRDGPRNDSRRYHPYDQQRP